MGRPPKTVAKSHPVVTLHCCNCGKEYKESDFYISNSIFFIEKKRIPYCKNCINNIYEYYCHKYEKEGYDFPERNAIKRICMAFDLFYSDKTFESALHNTELKPSMSLVSSYFKVVSLVQNKRKNYDTTLLTEREDLKEEILTGLENEKIKEFHRPNNVKAKTIKFFGTGFSDEDYEFLQNEYDDWTTRHECKTKAQEEVFKQICFTQLELQKASRARADTKDLMATFQKLLDTAKLQPKQNHSDTISDAQTFGTLIDKWETTRPLPEIDPELKDVDKIGLYLDVFFKGHLAKMMGLKNGLSRLYDNYIAKYTVNKPEYEDDEDSEALFDSIFGSPSNLNKD